MDYDPFALIEGMIIAAFATGAPRGFIYLRYEYPETNALLEKCLAQAREAGLLGNNILDSGFEFHLYVRRGAGAYICGEEGSLLNSLEGKHPFPRNKPPFPVTHGFEDKPTVVNNVETLCAVPHILNKGAEWYQSLGLGDHVGTKLISLSGDIIRPGNYEVPFGLPLKTLLYDWAGGPKDGRTIHASRLGYRINESFVNTFFGRMFSAPGTIFTGDMLRPEEQSEEDYIDGIDNIVETQKRIAENYFKDGSIDVACPPLKALLNIMVEGHFEGKKITALEVRGLFDRETVLASNWYQARLDTKVIVEQNLIARKITALEDFLNKESHESEISRLGILENLKSAMARQSELETTEYRNSLIGTIGTDPALAEA